MIQVENNITVCVVAYNRPKSLTRILNSLSNSYYPNKKVTLYISIDKDDNNSSENLECFNIAEEFDWKYGNKIVDYKKKNLGLRNHILECGNLTNKYENIIVLEDDLVVSQNYYNYALSVLKYYKNDKKIAGFALYSYNTTEGSHLPFLPLKYNGDTYFMQFTCSTGQMWTKKQWNDFYEWYMNNKDINLESDSFPKYISNWDNKSWKKYYTKYLIDNDKYFVYPIDSMSTNFDDAGVHNLNLDIAYQTYMFVGKKDTYKFINIKDSLAVYDAYFENKKINKMLGTNEFIESNIYDIKTKYQGNYILTTKQLKYKIVKSFGLKMYPYEQNIINNVEGNDLFLYDIRISVKNKKIKSLNFYNYIYRLGELNKKDYYGLLKYIFKFGCRKFLDKIKK